MELTSSTVFWAFSRLSQKSGAAILASNSASRDCALATSKIPPKVNYSGGRFSKLIFDFFKHKAGNSKDTPGLWESTFWKGMTGLNPDYGKSEILKLPVEKWVELFMMSACTPFVCFGLSA